MNSRDIDRSYAQARTKFSGTVIKQTILKLHTSSVFPPRKTPQMTAQHQQWQRTKPLAGIKILHNIPLTLSTVVKINALISAGAEVTVTNYQGVVAQPEAIAALKEAGIPYIDNHKNCRGEFDIALDCGAQVLKMPNVIIKRGVVELTQSGAQEYQRAAVNFPVIDVDASTLKCLESMYGTGEGFLRAIKKLTTPNLAEKSFIIFGFGKVGKGIARYLAKENADITVVDMRAKEVLRAKEMGYKSIHSSQIELIKQATKQAFCIVTATGMTGILSKTLTPEDTGNAWLANMGATDEIGDRFTSMRVLANKKPINFSLSEPTKIEFLDPIFTAHNRSAQILRQNKLKNGYHKLPKKDDEQLLAEWQDLHPEFDISEIKRASS